MTTDIHTDTRTGEAPAADDLAAAFDDLEAAGREARELVEATERFARYPDHRAQAYVSLAEARSMAYTMAVAPRTELPRLHAQGSWHATTASLGQNCPDMRYAVVLLDGARRYRLHGRLGELRLALWQVHNHVMGHPESREIGNYDLTDLAGPDRTVDLTISGDESADIRLDPESPLNFVLVRRILGQITEDYGDLHLDEVDSAPDAHRPLEIDPAHAALRIRSAAGLLRFFARNWMVGLYEYYQGSAGGKNRFCYIPGGAMATDFAGSGSTTYGFCVYELEPDEALIVEWDAVESAYWSWQLGDVWSNALDFFNYQTDLNAGDAVLDADGKVRAVVCDSDPGVPNWLDTRGRREGVVVLRNYKERTASVSPTARVVTLADLRAQLPAGTPSVSPEQRAERLRARRAAYHDAYGE